MPYHGTAIQLRGDPFIHKKIFKVAKKAGRFAAGFIPGPVGGVVRGVLGGGPRGPVSPRFVSQAPALPAVRGRGVITGIGPGGAFLGAGAISVGAPAAAAMVGADGCPKGHRLNKSDYFLKTGQFVAAGTRCVRIRRTNPGNTRALRRSLRRVESFAGLVSRTRRAARRVKKI